MRIFSARAPVPTCALRAAVGLQRQPAEVPVAEHIGERLTLPAALYEPARDCALHFGQRPVVLGVELDAL